MHANDQDLMPRRATRGSAGYDFFAPYDIVLEPGKETFVDTGVSFDGSETVTVPMSYFIPYPMNSPLGKGMKAEMELKRWAMVLMPRSGLGTKYGVRFVNTLGLIDMDYRDTIKATLVCDKPVTIKRGERFMQGVILSTGIFENEIEPTEERMGGHGSTGA